MQRCFLVINKETQVASYLQHRSIVEVTEEHRSLLELNLEKLDIVDVEKFLYIYYPMDDSDMSFRSDMNALRNLMSSAFFHVSEALFIFVNNQNPLLEDLVFSALRDCPLTRDKIEIINHSGSLMLPDVGTYLSGSASGQSTQSSYKDVYVREADKEEKDRFLNVQEDGLNSVLSVLTDTSALYKQRSEVEALSSGRVVTDTIVRPSIVSDFSRVTVDKARTLEAFIVSGERWTNAEQAVVNLVKYFLTIGRRCLVVNIDQRVDINNFVTGASQLDLMDIKAPISREYPVCTLNIRFNQLGYVVQYLRNVRGIDQYIFYSAEDDYMSVLRLMRQLCERTYAVFVAHYNIESIEEYLNKGLEATALFLNFGRFSDEFNLSAYKSALKGTLVAEFPTEDINYSEFYEYAIGGVEDD